MPTLIDKLQFFFVNFLLIFRKLGYNENGPPLSGLYPNGLFTIGLFMIGLSPFGLPMMFGLSPFGLL